MAGEFDSNGWTLVPILHLEILTSRVGGLGGHCEGGVCEDFLYHVGEVVLSC